MLFSQRIKTEDRVGMKLEYRFKTMFILDFSDRDLLGSFKSIETKLRTTVEHCVVSFLRKEMSDVSRDLPGPTRHRSRPRPLPSQVIGPSRAQLLRHGSLSGVTDPLPSSRVPSVSAGLLPSPGEYQGYSKLVTIFCYR